MIENQPGDLPIIALSTIFGRTIVGRLRIAFLSFMLISIAVVALVWKQMEQLSVVETAIFEDALPALRLNQEIDRHLRNVVSHASAMTSHTSLNKVNEIYKSIKSEKWSLHQILNNNSLQEHDSDVQLSALVLKIDNLTEELFLLTTQRFFVLSESENAIEKIKGEKANFTLSSENEYLDSWGQLNQVAQSPTLNRNSLTESVASLGTQIEVESQILQLFVLIDSLKDSTTVDQLRTYVQRIEFITQNSAQALLSRPRTATLVRLSQTLDNINQIVNGPTGLVQSRIRYIEIENRRSLLSQQILYIVSQISTQQREMILSTEGLISDIGKILNTTISRTILICIFGPLTVIVAALLISKIVLRNQIANRMSKLSQTVEELARGEIDIEVDTSGSDEISLIAGSLNKFKRNAKELLRSNADLERFAYIASHDLREPIHAIQNLASWTIEDCRSKIPPESLENLELILSRTKRMRQLTGDLLKYAQLNEADQNICKFSCKALCDDILDFVVSDCNFSFTLDIPDQDVTGPITPIRQIISNLIGNSIKHHDKETGHIVISVRVADNVFEVTVQDDGPGIPKVFQNRVFEPFFRLESQDDVPGSGMGLAAVSRLVQTFDGNIELQSDPETRRGTIITASIPLPGQDRHVERPGLKRSA